MKDLDGFHERIRVLGHSRKQRTKSGIVAETLGSRIELKLCQIDLTRCLRTLKPVKGFVLVAYHPVHEADVVHGSGCRLQELDGAEVGTE